MKKPNPCKGRETGCTGKPKRGELRCKVCKELHNARERERRQSRKAAALCTVCGAEAAKVNGVSLGTCQAHREYFAERAQAARAVF